MNFFKEWIILEMLGAFEYKLPKDKEQQLYDFYMLSQLIVQSKQQKGTEWSSGTELYPDVKDKLTYAIWESAKILYPTLKKNLLAAVMFSLCAEFRHIFELNTVEKINFILGEHLGEKYSDIFSKYASSMTSNLTLALSNPRHEKVIRQEPKDGFKSARRTSFIAAMNAGSPEDWARIQQVLFQQKNMWIASYGGEMWAKIAYAWQQLFNATTMGEQMIWIDHVYDLQHNTDTVFNKLTSYLKEGGYEWLKRALDHKHGIKHPIEIIDKISPSMRQLALPAIKAFTGKTLEDWQKEKSKSSEEKSKSSDGFSKSTQNAVSMPYTLDEEIVWDKTDGGPYLIESRQYINLKTARFIRNLIHDDSDLTVKFNKAVRIIMKKNRKNPILPDIVEVSRLIRKEYDFEKFWDGNVASRGKFPPKSFSWLPPLSRQFIEKIKLNITLKTIHNYSSVPVVSAIKIFREGLRWSLMASKNIVMFILKSEV